MTVDINLKEFLLYNALVHTLFLHNRLNNMKTLFVNSRAPAMSDMSGQSDTSGMKTISEVQEDD